MLISYLTYKFCTLKPCYCTRWFACYDYPGEGHTPLYGLYGDVPLDRALSENRIYTRYTRHKRAVIKRYLISTNRNIHPYIIRLRTPGKFKLSFRSCNRSSQHRPCLTRNLKRSNSGFHILANLIRLGLEKLKMFTVNKKKRHQWQIVEPQQKHKHKIQLVTFQYLCMYLIMITTNCDSTPVHCLHCVGSRSIISSMSNIQSYDCEPNLPPVITTANEMVYSRN